MITVHIQVNCKCSSPMKYGTATNPAQEDLSTFSSLGRCEAKGFALVYVHVCVCMCMHECVHVRVCVHACVFVRVYNLLVLLVGFCPDT